MRQQNWTHLMTAVPARLHHDSLVPHHADNTTAHTHTHTDWSFAQLIAPVVTTNSVILCFNKHQPSRAKLQSNHQHQQTNIQFLQAGCPSCHPTNSVIALKGKISHSMDLLTPSSPGGLPVLLNTDIGYSSLTGCIINFLLNFLPSKLS